MAWQTPIAAGAEGIFWFIVVLFVIISKIVNASKKNAPPAQKTRLPDADGSPEDELRDFLKRLSQGPEQPRPRPPPPPATPPPLPAQTIRTTASSQTSATRARPQPARPPAGRTHSTGSPPPPAAKTQSPAPVLHVRQEAVETARTAVVAAAPTAADKRRAAIVADLKNRDILKEAILLREILGPPLALRRQASHAFTG